MAYFRCGGGGHSDAEYNNLMDQLVEETATGPIASFTDGANNIPTKQVICHINPTETGTGEKSPNNPYVIGGHTGINVTQRGINLWDEQWACENKDISTRTGNLIPSPSSYYFRSLNYIPVTPNTTIYNYNQAVSGYYRFFFYDQNKDYLSYISNPSNATVSIPNNAYYMLFRFQANAQTIYENNISINYPSTDTDYHAYNGKTHNVPFGQTVYGGELVLHEGRNDKLTGWRKITLDGTQPELVANWRPLTNTIGFFYNFTNMNMKIPSAITIVPTGTSNKLNPVTYNNIFGTDAEGFSFAKAAPNYERVFIRIADTSLTTKDAINAYLAQNPIDIYYAEETPTEITLPTKTQVKTLLGANNIYHDCNGDTDVTYRANGELYVEQHPITRGLMAARPTEQIQEQEEQQEEKEINKSEDNEK